MVRFPVHGNPEKTGPNRTAATLLAKRYRSASGALTKRRNVPSCGETKSKSETSVVSDTEQPDAAAKAQLREEGETDKKSSKLWN
jgi:hypothetical protein